MSVRLSEVENLMDNIYFKICNVSGIIEISDTVRALFFKKYFLHEKIILTSLIGL